MVIRLEAAAGHFEGSLMLMALALVIAAISSACDKTEAILLIERPTEVQDGSKEPYPPEWPHTNREPEKIIAILNPGERVSVIGVYHGKDYDAYEVKLVDGRKGYIIAGNTFKVLPYNGN
jgi:hypothetical protein